ncbi:MAG TPA: lipopolysaccharide kinase InaA family protein, partial [Thermoanaerobaculia bacterium]|nr:lipopolysaccharide kinase InaA family protein [Thermoanaerobaculia bacterium]
HLAGWTEARYYVRALNAGEAEARFPDLPSAAFLAAVAALARRLHDRGFWHRDLSAGNVLIGPGAPGEEPPLALVDLNRARHRARLRLSHRLRDLCRLPLMRREHQEALLGAYFGAAPPPAARRLYRLYHRVFHGRHRFKNRWRGRLGALRAQLLPRRPYPHLPPPPPGARARERVVWDRLSDQPHQHAGGWAKLAVRLGDAPNHARAAWGASRLAPRALRRYRRLRAELYRRPVPFTGLGVGLRPWPQDPDGLLQAVDGLGVRHLLLRLHPWEAHHDDEEALARALRERGCELSFALPQTRELVRDPVRWRQAVEELAARFTPYGRRFVVGQAINRSKWGVWNVGEYQRLAGVAAQALRRHPGVEVLGPGVIDFEPHYTAAVLDWPGSALRLDGLASLLYVDRRGAPENPQLGLDTVGKVTLLRALAETGRCVGAPRSWITEVNWPLREGPHAPAGRHVAVDESTAADYLARYYLLALATGYVERVFWWQLVARGYGLAVAEDGKLRRRPAYHALAALARLLEGATFLGPLTAPSPAYLYHFRDAAGGELVAAWCRQGSVEADLPWRPAAAIGRGGEELPPPPSPRVRLGPSVAYYRR